jgi:hypothetical protein
MEAVVGSVTFVESSMYFDIKRHIDGDLKMQAVMTHAKGMGIVFAIDSNARPTSWHNVMTNNGIIPNKQALAHRE